MRKKKCNTCLETKVLSQFYRHKQTADGYLGKCASCKREEVTKYRIDNLEEVRRRDRERSGRPERVKARKKISERWKKDPKLRKRTLELKKIWISKNRIKRAAHIITDNYIARGKLIRKPCEICGKKKVEAHHDDYSRPLDVKWLCKRHHTEHHKAERERLRNK